MTEADTSLEQPTVSLVLGSGGAKGLAHIGVIRCLQDRGLQIRYVAGSSIGALVGGIHAAGKLDDYSEWVTALQRSDVLRLLDLSFDRGSLFKGNRIVSVLEELIGDQKIENLPFGYTAVATDLSSRVRGREVWFNRGSLFTAIRASIAVPTIFAPVEFDGMLLVDGGIMNPLPVAPTLNDRTEMTIAVDLNGPMDASNPLGEQPAPQKPAYQQKISQFLDRFRGEPELEEEKTMGFQDIAMRSMEAMQTSLTQFKLAAAPPDVIVSIPRDLCGFFDFHRGTDLIEFGYARTEFALNHAGARAKPLIE